MAHHGAVSAEQHLAQLHAHEDNLFPPQMFLSPAMGCRAQSLLHLREPYGECIQVAGRAYAGEFCTRVITEVAKIDEVSVVPDVAPDPG